MLNKRGYSLSAQRASFCRVHLALVERQQCWGDLSVVKENIIVFEDLLTLAEIHEAEIDTLTIDGLHASKIAHHVVSWLVHGAHVIRRVREHDDPRFIAGTSIDDPVRVSLVIEEA